MNANGRDTNKHAWGRMRTASSLERAEGIDCEQQSPGSIKMYVLIVISDRHGQPLIACSRKTWTRDLSEMPKRHSHSVSPRVDTLILEIPRRIRVITSKMNADQAAILMKTTPTAST